MSIEVLPQGVKCSLACDYCYQQPIRMAGNALDSSYDMDAMKAALIKEGYKFTIFGGEPLLMPIADLEELWRFGIEQFGEAARKHGDNPNSVQTHGADMTDEHIALFRKYHVGVGMSIDGPDELNDARWAGSEERTRAASARSNASLEKLLNLKHPVSLIVTLTRMNASPERLPRLVDWLRNLAQKGLRNVNLHLLEVDNPGVREKLSLTTQENISALLTVGRLQDEVNLAVEPLTDMVRLLRGEDLWGKLETGGYRRGVSCTWNGCDPYTTAAVHGVDGQGNRGNCGRTCKEGPFWEKASQAGYERYLSLGSTPLAYDGCKGCRFFYACKGHCPGEGITGDWREKTEHCGVIMGVMGILEADLVRAGKEPISLSPVLPELEKRMMQTWQQGKRPSITQSLEAIANGTQVAEPASQSVNVPHGDVPHGDHTDTVNPLRTHGDHTDHAGRIGWGAL